MRFWDTSAVIPLIGDEPTSEAMLHRLEEDPQILLWWGTPADPSTLEFVCLDDRLNAAARREGFIVIDG